MFIEIVVRKIHKYILLNFFLYLFISVIFFTGVLLAGNIMKSMMDLLIEGKLSIDHACMLLINLLPSLVSYALPFGFVFATLLTFGKLSYNQEYIALKSAGISPLNIFSTVLFVASLGVLLSLSVNFYYAPISISNVRQKIGNAIREDPLRFISQKKFIKDFPGYILFVNEIDNGILKDFKIWELNNDKECAECDELITFVEAKTGSLIYDDKKNALSLTLFNGTIDHKIDKDKESPLITFETLTLDLKMDNIFKNSSSDKKIKHMTYSELLNLKKKSILSGDKMKYMEVQVDLQMKCAMAFGILALVLVTIPLSIMFARKENFINFIIALLICIGYYVVMMLISFLEKKPHLYPDLLLWIPNFLLQTVGIISMRRLCKS